jgi:hypothetical protein
MDEKLAVVFNKMLKLEIRLLEFSIFYISTNTKKQVYTDILFTPSTIDMLCEVDGRILANTLRTWSPQMAYLTKIIVVNFLFFDQ